MTHTRWLLFIVALLFAWHPAADLSARVSVNVPVGHWSYKAIDKLTGLGLIHSHMRGTKPVTRLEMARLVAEAQSESAKLSRPDVEAASSGRLEIIRAILGRLVDEFQAELENLKGTGGGSYLKPVEDAYVHYFHGNHDLDMENDKGQELAEGSNVRAGFSTHGVFFNHLGYYFNPEYRFSEDRFGDDHRLDIVEGYGKLEAFNVEVEAGRDSLWWGTGRHGSLVLSDNAQPLDLVKFSNPRPVLLPWIFKYLGLCKFTAFWSELESSRVVPEAELMGFRINIKPFPFFEIGASRTVMLGGKGGAKGLADLSLGDWGDVLSGRNVGGELNTNQIGGIDFEFLFPDLDRWLPFVKSVNFWGEWYGEDEAGGLPSKEGYVAGLKFNDLFLSGKTDLTFEYADNVISGEPGVWYGHSVYQTGYRYRGDILGHNMGGDARDYFARLEHYLTAHLIAGLAFNRQEKGIEARVQEERDRYDLDLLYWRSERLRVNAGYRFEAIDNLGRIEGNDEDNHILWLFLDYSF